MAETGDHQHNAEWLHQQLHENVKRHLEDDADNNVSFYDTIGQCVPLMRCPDQCAKRAMASCLPAAR